jgi:hypothetical protein
MRVDANPFHSIVFERAIFSVSCDVGVVLHQSLLGHIGTCVWVNNTVIVMSHSCLRVLLLFDISIVAVLGFIAL